MNKFCISFISDISFSCHDNMVVFWSYWKNAWKSIVDMFTVHTGVCYSSLLTEWEKQDKKKVSDSLLQKGSAHTGCGI